MTTETLIILLSFVLLYLAVALIVAIAILYALGFVKRKEDIAKQRRQDELYEKLLRRRINERLFDKKSKHNIDL